MLHCKLIHVYYRPTKFRLYTGWLKKVSCCTVSTAYVFSYTCNSTKHWRIFIIFGRNVTEKASNHMLLYFLPHLINASTLPCETENPEIVNSLLFLSHPVYCEGLVDSGVTKVGVTRCGN